MAQIEHADETKLLRGMFLPFVGIQAPETMVSHSDFGHTNLCLCYK